MSEKAALGKATCSSTDDGKGFLVDCPTCGSGFESNAGLTYHLNRDDNNCKGNSCPECDKQMRTWHGVVRHYGMVHEGSIGGVKCVCDTCGEKFRRPKSLQEKFDNTYCSLNCQPGLFGEDNPRWKGGKERYYGPNWHKQKRKALKRDQYRCQRCLCGEHDNGRKPDVHHIRRLADFKERYDDPTWYKKANRLGNLLCLCITCHQKWEGIPLRIDNR